MPKERAHITMKKLFSIIFFLTLSICPVVYLFPDFFIGHSYNLDVFIHMSFNAISGFEAQFFFGLFLLSVVVGIFILKKPSNKTDATFNKYKKTRNLSKMDWREFEYLTATYFKKKGFKCKVEGGSGGDGGVDLKISKGSKFWIVQCKHWKSKVGVSTIREMYGSSIHFKANGVKIVSSSGFTKGCYDFAKGKKIELIDGHKLQSGL